MMHRANSFFTRLDPHLLEVLNGTVLAFVLRAFGAGLAFALNVVIGRLLGAEGAGLYFLAFSVISITSVITRLGLENTVLRFVASHANSEDWGRVRGVLRYALRWSGGMSLAASVGVVAGAPLIARWVFGSDALTPVLVSIAFSILGFNVMTLTGEALKGLSRVRDSMLVNGVLYPAGALLVIWPATTLLGPAGAGLAYMVGTIMASVAGLLIWCHALIGKPQAKPVDRVVMRASSQPLWVSMILVRGIQPWAPLFLLGIWADSTAVGVFGAATRVALLVSFFLFAINTVLAPRFSALHARGDLAGISRLARRFTLLIVFAASPAFLVFIFAGNWVMSLFGEDFAHTGSLLAILAVGQAANTITGPVGVVLMMGGREKDMRTLSLISVTVTILLSFTLIPFFGAAGAAIASSSGIFVTSLAACLLVRARFGIWVVPLMPVAVRGT